MNKTYLLTLLLSLSLTQFSFAQFQSNEEDEDGFLYRKEFVSGINFNTNGGLIGGAMMKYALAITPRMYHSFSLEIVNIKHPKERRLQNRNNGITIIPEKQNFLFVVRPHYGREFILFKKAKERGIQVNLLTSIGPSIGVVAPYLIEYNSSGEVVQFNPNLHGNYSLITGTGSIAESISQASYEIGGSFKTSMSFEFGTFKNNVTGFEAGLMLDKFSNDIVIIPRAENRNFYSSIFLTFFFGVRN